MNNNFNNHYKMILLLGIILLSGCFSKDPYFVIKGYIDCEEYFEDGWMDYTDYCLYFYTPKDDALFQNSSHYQKLSNNKMSELQSFLKDYNECIVFREGYRDWYDFDSMSLSLDDYYILQVNQKDGDKYHNYDIYYYDTSKHILYYFHNDK
jgi:hypothetical protein